MKSSRPGSAHWRSSKRSTVVPCSAIRSKKMRQAANRSSRPPPAPARGRGASAAPARPSAGPPRRARIRRRWPRLARGWWPRRRPPARPAAPPDHLAEGPERDALAVRGRAAPVPPDRLADAVDVLLELPGQAALADAARPGDRDEAGPPVAAGRGDGRSLSRRSSSSRPTNGGSGRSERPWPPRWATTRSARHAGDGAALPLRTCSPGLLEGDRRARPRACVASPTRTVPGWRRRLEAAAVLTRSPATMPWFVAPRVTAASPVRTPARAWIAGAQHPDRVDQLQRGADGPLGVVLAGRRRAPDGHHRVADELLHRAAVAAR